MRLARCCLIGSLAICCSVAVAPRISQAQNPRVRDALSILKETRDRHFREFANQMEKLAQSCEDKSMNEAAELVRSRVINIEPQSHNLRTLPREVTPDIPNNLPDGERFWRTQLRALEKDYSQDLYLLSRRALNDGYPSNAYTLVRESAMHDPDHPAARKILGFVRQGNEWVTQFAASQIKARNVWHEEFGWLPKEHLARYTNGERYFKSHWVSAEKERELRRDFSNAWQIRTDHYLIKTNVSLERGVELGRALEDFHEFFYETFAGFFATREQMMHLFDGSAKAVTSNPRPYMIHYYRTREEYVAQLKKEFPNIGITNGIYMTTDRTAHFYHDPNNDNEATLYHEGTHQLFFESHTISRPIGDNAHFWIIEGIACYMESFQRKAGDYSLGDPSYIRFQGARVNLLQKGYYVPLREFSAMGMRQFQTQTDLAKNYTQAAGLARFFMEYEDGRYREILVKHLAQLYSSNTRERETAPGLDKLTDVSFEVLDKQYAEDAKANEKASVEELEN
ncbi:MAG: hypothetical protein JWP89_2789 [Schlesneria sp.]|nr:hypothetical protein [Schlesneria sp.]